MKKHQIVFVTCICFLALSCVRSTDTEGTPFTEKSFNMNKLAKYNLWANKQFVEWLSHLDDELFTVEVKSSFPTIRGNIFHLWHAEFGWFKALKEEEWTTPKNSIDSISNPALLDGFLKDSKELTEFVLTLNDSLLHQHVELNSGKTVSRNDILIHVFNHATFHRGQIITIARNLGVTDLPRTDYIYFVLEQ